MGNFWQADKRRMYQPDWPATPLLLQGIGLNDQHLAERILNVATSLPFVILGIRSCFRLATAFTASFQVLLENVPV